MYINCKFQLLLYYFLYTSVGVFTQNTNSKTSENCQTPKGKLGECVLLSDCPELDKMVRQKPLTEDIISFLRKSQCGYGVSQPKVCCDLKGDVSSDLLPDLKICGTNSQNRIVGGKLTALNEFPWMAVIEYLKPSGRGFHCGGALITKRHVLTAAHCLKRVPKTWKAISVRLGEHDLSSERDCEDDTPGLEYCSDPPLNIEIEKAIVHEQYRAEDDNQPNDIAVLKLKEEVEKFTEFVKPICLPTLSDLRSNTFADFVTTVAGWGRTENSSQSNLKLKLDLPVKQQTDCVAIYGKSGHKIIDTQLCAGGNKGEDSCSGDSGGPLMILNRSDSAENWYIIAVVSYGPTACGIKDFPGVYTRVGSFMPWIIDSLKV